MGNLASAGDCLADPGLLLFCLECDSDAQDAVQRIGDGGTGFQQFNGIRGVYLDGYVYALL